jgi:tight adherence protein B
VSIHTPGESNALLPALRPTQPVAEPETPSHGSFPAAHIPTRLPQAMQAAATGHDPGYLVAPPASASLLHAPAIPVPPFLAAGALIGVLSSLAARSAMPAVLAPAVALLIRSRMLRSQLRTSESDQRAAVVDFCAALRAELQAGRQPSASIAEAIWCRPELRDLAEACAGPAAQRDPADLLSAAARTPGREGLGALAACWRATERHGVPLTEAVCGIEDGLRAEQQRRQGLAAELAGVRATVALLGVLPGFGLALGCGLGTDPLHTLLTQPVGEACLLVGFLLEVTGLRWTDRLVGSVLHEPGRDRRQFHIRARRSRTADRRDRALPRRRSRRAS